MTIIGGGFFQEKFDAVTFNQRENRMKKHFFLKIRNISQNDKGFTILEVIMAVSILTIGLLAVASLQITAIRGNSMSMEYTESTEKVQDIIEKLYNKDFTDDELNDDNGDGVNGLDNITEDTADHYIPGQEYDIFWNVANNTARDSDGWYSRDGVKTIRIIIKWDDRGHSKSFKYDLLRNRI